MLTEGQPQQRMILIIKCVGCPVLWMQVNHFPQPSLSSPNGSMSKRAMVAGWRLCLVSATWTYYTHQGQPGYDHHGVSNLAVADQQWFPNMALLLRVINSYLVAGNYIRLLSSWKGQSFVLSRIAIYSGYRFAFPTHKASAKTIICGLTACLIYCHSISQNITSG